MIIWSDIHPQTTIKSLLNLSVSNSLNQSHHEKSAVLLWWLKQFIFEGPIVFEGQISFLVNFLTSSENFTEQSPFTLLNPFAHLCDAYFARPRRSARAGETIQIADSQGNGAISETEIDWTKSDRWPKRTLGRAAPNGVNTHKPNQTKADTCGTSWPRGGHARDSRERVRSARLTLRDLRISNWEVYMVRKIERSIKLIICQNLSKSRIDRFPLNFVIGTNQLHKHVVRLKNQILNSRLIRISNLRRDR
jgi:hypothetical protein